MSLLVSNHQQEGPEKVWRGLAALFFVASLNHFLVVVVASSRWERNL